MLFACSVRAQGAQFQISFSSSVHEAPITGRVFVFLTTDGGREPRFQSGGTGADAPFFAKDVEGLRPGDRATIDASTLGYPIRSIAVIPPGDYYVQALLNVYTEFRRADGHTIWAHMDQWEGQQIHRLPGQSCKFRSESSHRSIDAEYSSSRAVQSLATRGSARRTQSGSST